MSNAPMRLNATPSDADASPAAAVSQSTPLQRSIELCRDVTREHARNFYYGLKLTPEPQRSALYVVYAFMRACDDLVDQPIDKHVALEPVQVGIDRVEQFRAKMMTIIEGGTLPEEQAGDTIWPAFRHVMQQYPIEPAHLHAMLDGQRCDLVKTRYETFDELYDYCFKVASVVGLVCINVWGAGRNPAAVRLAEYRGIALQLTNILRDVVEDANRSRVYIPSAELERFNYDPADFALGKADENFDRLMAFQIERTRKYYEMSLGLEQHLDASCRPACWAIMRIYRGLFDKIEKNPRRVLTERVRLSNMNKAMIAMHASLRRSLGLR